MKTPNFFILGAPKCGTTSLASWLSTHPNAYMSSQKEPFFFDTDEKVIGRPTPREYQGYVLGGSKQPFRDRRGFHDLSLFPSVCL